MKFVVDQPVSPVLAEWLRSVGHDAFSSAGTRALAASRPGHLRAGHRGGTDHRHRRSRLLPHRRARGRREPGLILFRAGNISDQDMLRLLKEVLSRVAAGVVEHAVLVVDRHGFRTSPLPLRPDLMADKAE